MKKILVSTISFVNKEKQDTEIYTTFAKRLINDVITKTPFDVLVSTNEINLFNDVQKTDRITIRNCDLGLHKTNVKAFNQLLKFYSIKDINEEYEWVLYMDCDAGFTTQINVDDVINYLNTLDSKNFDMSALRTDATYDMEAFEIGVSAKLSGYNVAEMTWGRQNDLFKVGFNFNNWEKIKR